MDGGLMPVAEPLVQDRRERAAWLLLRRPLYGLLAAIDDIFGVDGRAVRAPRWDGVPRDMEGHDDA